MLDISKHLMTIEDKDGTTRKYLPAAIRVQLFRSQYPQGRIASTIKDKGERFCFAEAEIYLHYRDEYPIATAHAEALLSQYDDFSHIVEAAETKAICRALAYAGFGTPIDEEITEDEPADTGIRVQQSAKPKPNAMDIVENEEKPREAPAEGKAETQKAAEETKPAVKPEPKVEQNQPQPQTSAPVAPAQPDPAEIRKKLQEARGFVCQTGEYNGKTLGEIYLSDPKCIEHYARQINSKIGDYARIILKYSPKRK